MSIREEMAKVEIGNVLDTDGKRIGGLVEIGDSGASQLISLIIGEIEKVENPFSLKAAKDAAADIAFGKMVGFERAREAFINKLKG